MCIFACANAFWLLGRNQVQFDRIKEDEEPLYTTVGGALKYIYMLCLGEVGDTPFEIGETPHNKRSLWIVYIVTTLTLLVHMMNMLIAIMSETFAKNREFSDQIRLKSQLRFVIDNWSLKDDAFGKGMGKINYLVAALLNEEDDDEIEIIKDI